MKAVGITQLKAHLSEYVRAVKAGESILVTERDEVVAELRPARRQGRPLEDAEEILDALAESGEITRASRSWKGWRLRKPALGLPEGAAQELLDELRSERV
jgi:prevent-host-death family protein